MNVQVSKDGKSYVLLPPYDTCVLCGLDIQHLGHGITIVEDHILFCGSMGFVVEVGVTAVRTAHSDCGKLEHKAEYIYCVTNEAARGAANTWAAGRVKQ